MTRGVDNDEWLKNIGAVTVHEDDDKGDLGPAVDPPLAAPGEEVGAEEGTAEPGDDYGIEEEAASGSDDGYAYPDERPFEPFEPDEDHTFGGDPSSGHDETYQGPGLLLGPELGAASDPVVDPAPTRTTNSSPRRFTPWVLAAFGAAAVLGTIVTLVVTMANSPSSESAAHSPAPVAPGR